MRIRAGAGEDVLIEQRIAHLARRPVADKAEQETPALDADDRSRQATIPYLCFALAHVCQQVLVPDGVDDRVDGGGCKWPAPERGTEIAGTETPGDVIAGEDSGAGDSAAKRLCARQQVGFDIVCLDREIVPATPHAALHLVGNQEGTVSPGRVAQGTQEFGRQVECAGDALHGLDDNGRDVRADHCLGRGTVVARDEIDVEGLLREAVPPVGIPRDGARGGRAAVKTMRNREHLAPLRDRTGHAQSVLVGFRTRVHEEHSVERGGCNGDEFLCRLSADVQRDGVALKQQGFRLFPDRGRQPRVPVSQRRDGMPAVEVEYVPAIAGDDLAARRVLGHERQLPVDGDRCCRLSCPRIAPVRLHRVHLRSSPAGCRSGRPCRAGRKGGSSTGRHRLPRP